MEILRKLAELFFYLGGGYILTIAAALGLLLWAARTNSGASVSRDVRADLASSSGDDDHELRPQPAIDQGAIEGSRSPAASLFVLATIAAPIWLSPVVGYLLGKSTGNVDGLIVLALFLIPAIGTYGVAAAGRMRASVIVVAVLYYGVAWVATLALGWLAGAYFGRA